MDLRRRQLLIAVASTAPSLAPLLAFAQQAKRVGVLLPHSETDVEGREAVAAFVKTLAKLGWRDGANLRLDIRLAGADRSKMAAYAKELVAAKPDVIFARTTPATLAVIRETGALPVVFASVTDPVGDGIVKSFARPGTNATGFTNYEESYAGKWIELLKEMDPRIRRVAVLSSPKHAPRGGKFYDAAIERSATAAGVRAVPVHFETAAELERGVGAFAKEPDGALLALPDVVTLQLRKLITDLAERYKMPAMWGANVAVREGALMAYGADNIGSPRLAAGYVDRVLRGARPADLPVQAPAKFELIVNRKAAKAIGREIPRQLLLRADEVIE